MIRVVFRAGKPYLFGTAWKTLLEPNGWLYSLRGDGATQSPQTWRVYAYALGDHLAWCQREGLDWRMLGGPEMERYLSSLAVGDNTLNWKIAVLVRFFAGAPHVASGWGLRLRSGKLSYGGRVFSAARRRGPSCAPA